MPQIVLSKRFLRIVNTFVGILLFVLLLLFVYYVDKVFRIKTIIVDKNKSEISVNGIEEFKNKNSLLISKDFIINSLKSKNPKVKIVTVKIMYPSTLTLNLTFERDFINIATNMGYFITDNKGKILEKNKVKKSNLPLLTYFQKIDHSSYQPGNIIDYRDIILALYFVENIDRLGLFVNTVDISSLYMIRFKIGDKIVIFSTEKDKDIQMYELRLILKRYKSEGNNYNTIDLRFDKPVLKISN